MQVGAPKQKFRHPKCESSHPKYKVWEFSVVNLQYGRIYSLYLFPIGSCKGLQAQLGLRWANCLLPKLARQQPKVALETRTGLLGLHRDKRAVVSRAVGESFTHYVVRILMIMYTGMTWLVNLWGCSPPFRVGVSEFKVTSTKCKSGHQNRSPDTKIQMQTSQIQVQTPKMRVQPPQI